LSARRAEHEKVRKQMKELWCAEVAQMQSVVTQLHKARSTYIKCQQEWEQVYEESQKSDPSVQGKPEKRKTTVDEVIRKVRITLYWHHVVNCVCNDMMTRTVLLLQPENCFFLIVKLLTSRPRCFFSDPVLTEWDARNCMCIYQSPSVIREEGILTKYSSVWFVRVTLMWQVEVKWGSRCSYEKLQGLYASTPSIPTNN